MAYRNVLITNPATLSVSKDQLVIVTDDRYTIPIEDICSVMIESRQVHMNSYALSKLASDGAAVFLCDEKHMPCGVVLPICEHSRHTKMLNLQLAQSKPYTKRLWQQLVVAKIVNQMICLLTAGENETADKLASIAKQVTSGDVKNAEGTAAAAYFRALFGKGFSRGKECITNAALNYGYAIIRGSIARCIVAYGFEPALGLHHASELNSFNLADDLLEPFRPIVDLYVKQNIDDDDDELTSAHKQGLYNILNFSVLSGGETHSAHYAIERCVMSLSRCFNNKKGELVLPVVTELKLHRYE